MIMRLLTPDWTTPEAYVGGIAPIPRRRLALARLASALDSLRLASRRAREERRLRREASEAEYLPNRLRADIGLPPNYPTWVSGIRFD